MRVVQFSRGLWPFSGQGRSSRRGVGDAQGEMRREPGSLMVISFRAVRAWSSWLTPGSTPVCWPLPVSHPRQAQARAESAPLAVHSHVEQTVMPLTRRRRTSGTNAAGLAAPLGEGRGRRQLGSGHWRPGVLTATIVMVILGINVDAQAQAGSGQRPRPSDPRRRPGRGVPRW